MGDDDYIYLEDANSERGMEFALLANRMCIHALGDPVKKSTTYSRILKSLEGDERIPFVSKSGQDDQGNDVLFNLWKDAKVCRLTKDTVGEPLERGLIFLCFALLAASEGGVAEDNVGIVRNECTEMDYRSGSR